MLPGGVAAAVPSPIRLGLQLHGANKALGTIVKSRRSIMVDLKRALHMKVQRNECLLAPFASQDIQSSRSLKIMPMRPGLVKDLPENRLGEGAAKPEMLFGFSSVVAKHTCVVRRDSPASKLCKSGKALVNGEPCGEATTANVKASPNNVRPMNRDCSGMKKKKVVDFNCREFARS